MRLPGKADSKINLACLAASKDTRDASKQAQRAKEGRREGRKARSAPRWCERAALRTSEALGGGLEEGEMLGLAPPATGTWAALPPLDPYGPYTPSKRRRKLVRKSATLALPGETSARPGSILCCPSQRKGKEEPSAASIHPHAVPGAASGDEERPRRARARIKPHTSSHEPLRTGQ